MAAQPISMQEAVSQLEAFRQQIDVASRNLQVLESMWQETVGARKTLEGWKDQKAAAHVLFPVGAQTYVRAKIEAPSEVIHGVGRGYATERPTEDAIARLQTREDELKVEADRWSATASQLKRQAAALESALDAGMQDEQAPGNGSSPKRKGTSAKR